MKLTTALLCLTAVSAFAPPQTSRTTTTTLQASTLEKLSTSQLKKLIKLQNPPKGTLRRLSTRSQKIQFLQSQQQTGGAAVSKKAASSVSLDSVGDLPFRPATQAFPGALSNAEFCTMIKDTLEGAGYDPSKTLVATSLCCDE